MYKKPAVTAEVAPAAQVSRTISGYRRKRANQLLRIPSNPGPGNALADPQAQRTRCSAAVSKSRLVRVGQLKLVRKTTGPDTVNALATHKPGFSWARGCSETATRQTSVVSYRKRLAIGKTSCTATLQDKEDAPCTGYISRCTPKLCLLHAGPKGQITRTPAKRLSGMGSTVRGLSQVQSNFCSRQRLYPAVSRKQTRLSWVNPQVWFFDPAIF